MIAAERAWVGPRNASITGKIEVGKEIEFNVEYANTGHEPGQNFSYSIDGFNETEVEDRNGTAMKKMGEFLQRCENSRNQIVGQVVFPTTGFNAYSLAGKLKSELATQDLLDGNITLVMQGCFLYQSFSAFRHTYFCYFYNAKRSRLTNLSICQIGDYAD
jgi:hypothetical protein